MLRSPRGGSRRILPQDAQAAPIARSPRRHGGEGQLGQVAGRRTFGGRPIPSLRLFRRGLRGRSVTEGNLKIDRIVVAIDPGHAVNPAQSERQVAGRVFVRTGRVRVWGCTVKDVAVEQTNFDTYNVIIMPSRGFWGGVGELSIFVVAPSVLKAIFAATDKRVRAVPLMNQTLS
jgi:hypothetical protein